MTVLGLGSYGVAWAIGVPGYETPAEPMDAVGLVRFAHTLDLKLVQIADNLPLDTLNETERVSLRQEAQACGVALEVGTRGIQTDHLRHYIEIASFFGSPILRVVIDSKGHHPSPDEVIGLVSLVLPVLESAGITLAIENHDRFKVATLAGIVEALNHPRLGICLDTVNSFGALEGPDVILDVLGKHVVSLHLKEFVVRRSPHKMGFVVTGAPAGQGMLNIPWLLDTLRAKKRAFNAIIETWLDPEATMPDTLAKEADWVRQSVRYLQPLIPN